MRTLLQVLNDRYDIAKSATEDHIDEVKRALDDYKAKKFDNKRDDTIHDRHLTKSRYSFRVPYIFVTHESILSALFDKPPELIFSGKGVMDEEKKKAVEFAYKYLFDKLNLEEVLETIGWWFLLVGFVSSYQDYKIEVEQEVPLLNEQGEESVDEVGETIMTPEYSYHDPVIFIDNPLKTYYAPDSEFSTDGVKVPYEIREKSMSVDEVKDTYGVEVEADEELDTKASKKLTNEQKSDIKRACIKYYCGKLPSEIAKQLESQGVSWSYKEDYIAVFTTNKILSIAEKKKYTAYARFYADQNEFFGFGLAKSLRDTQREMSIRRGQQIRYADMYAYPWLLVDGQTKIDQKALQSVQKDKPLVYNGQKPEYLVPPTMPDTIVKTDEVARSDAQFISGTLDLSKGAQDTNTVKTATGQQLFAQSQDKRTQKARRSIARMYKDIVKNLLELARDNWEEGKLITIIDDDGQTYEMEYKEDTLKGVNFDTDIDFAIDSITENQQIIAEREIALYDKTKGDPMFNQRKIAEGMLRNGFKKKNPTEYLATEEEYAQAMGGQMGQNQGIGMSEQGGAPPQQGGYENPIPDLGGQSSSLSLLGNELAPQPN